MSFYKNDYKSNLFYEIDWYDLIKMKLAGYEIKQLHLVFLLFAKL